MQKLDPLRLTAILDAMVLKPFTGLKSAARDHNVAASTAFRWQAESARHEKEDGTSLEYLIQWMGNRSWYHRHVALARRLSILRLDQRLREDAVVTRREYLFRRGGEPIWQVDPQLALDPLVWEIKHCVRDIKDVYKRGSNGELLQAYKEIPPNPQLLIKAVSALLPEVYGETIKHEVSVGGVLRVGTTASAAPQKQIEDAEFTMIGEASEDAPPPAVGIASRKVNWVLDADIAAFFDTVSHEWLIRFVEHRIGDQRVIRLIRKWLKAGVLEDNKIEIAETGAARGSYLTVAGEHLSPLRFRSLGRTLATAHGHRRYDHRALCR
jgi:hypothetical protein